MSVADALPVQAAGLPDLHWPGLIRVHWRWSLSAMAVALQPLHADLGVALAEEGLGGLDFEAAG